ncbi:transcription termination/antitermination protein NusA [Weissella confusa]|uniref:transcription termination factor NusA n=1 Tax=Weissella confusa TaxID=1583 RepID=UPI0018F23FED|nr:transcription termination factor NusA [Weissella confusa]MBJ7646951.1 transcription termination/antitermination protein NusA [Weissella confusa]MBJ7679443.1 transcription termination/antitermination protein NusA [Weissella confusa]MDA5458206.1 Transcription termination protein NusA [Weissella confusa]
MSKELVQALDALEQEKGIKAEVLVEAIEEALKKAYEKNYDESENVEVQFDQKKGNIKVYSVKTVVEEIDEPYEQITLEEALELNKAYEIGDEIRFEVTPADFGRLAAQTAKQIIMQKVREAERGVVYDKFIGYENEIITGEVERQDSRFLYIILPGNQEAAMKQGDQMPNETYRMGDKIKVLVSQVQNEQRGPQVFVSRTHADLVKRLFEAEVPEVFDGTVEIKSIAREAGDRSKIAVYSHNSNLDAVGTMVGQRGARVQAVVNELSGENMDIVEWTEDPAQFIKNALNPAEVVEVIFDPTNDRAVTVLVPDYQLSLAIGKRGQNARLAARLTGFKIDIKPESERDAVIADMANREEEAANAPVVEADVVDDFEETDEA